MRDLVIALILGFVLNCFLFNMADAQVKDGDEIPHPAIRMEASSAKSFAPEGWKIMDRAVGDLNGDKRPDEAIILCKEEEPEPDSDEFSPRCLVIALREQSKRLKRIICDWDLIPPSNAGGAGVGEAFQEMKVRNGYLFLRFMYGSNQRSVENYQYKLVNNALKPIGLNYSEYMSAQARGAEIDFNVATGYAICDNKVFEEDDGADPERKPPVVQKFYVVGDAPVRLVKSSSVVVGRQKWKGVSDLSASLKASSSSNVLVISADVTDDHVTASDTIRLVDQNGKIVKPSKIEKQNTKTGYSQRLEFSLSSLTGKTKGSDTTELLPATIEVVDYDTPAELHAIISTSDGGRKYTGQLNLSGSASMNVIRSILGSKNLY